MRTTTKLIIVAVMGLCSTAIGGVYNDEAQATSAVEAQQASPEITITTQDGHPSYLYSPDAVNATVGESITITNNDPNGIHSVTARDRSFNVDVPPNGSVTLTVEEPGSYPYYCTYHPDNHNPASINVS